MLKAIRSQVGVPRGVLDVAMPEVMLNRPCVVAVVRQFVAGRMAEHMRMNREPDAGVASRSSDDLSDRIRSQWCFALANENISSAGLLPL